MKIHNLNKFEIWKKNQNLNKIWNRTNSNYEQNIKSKQIRNLNNFNSTNSKICSYLNKIKIWTKFNRTVSHRGFLIKGWFENTCNRWKQWANYENKKQYIQEVLTIWIDTASCKYVNFLFLYTTCRSLRNLVLFATSLFPTCISAGTSGRTCHPSTVAFR
jgi:hypothetical protein